MGKKDKKHEGKDVLVPERAELVSPFEEMERWFGDFFNRPFFFSHVDAALQSAEHASGGTFCRHL
ncbi:hypothetical protein [Syntrophotalea carbinolica]|uniref:hypothetical protein n=1 Tax=Syntrophotalea carbinolica TaxID=19 RepID=UPI0002D586E9|nr:hypothetical protein [Syntrophotalea carbinolica]